MAKKEIKKTEAEAEAEEKATFRKSALEHIAAPKTLDDLISVTTSKAWILLVIITLLVSIGVIWAIFGTIVTRVQGQGILIAEKAELLSIFAPQSNGYIEKLFVKMGDPVKAGQVVAILKNPDAANQIKNKQAYLQQLKKQYEELKERAEKELSIKQKELDTRKKILQDVINNQTRKSKQLKDLLDGVEQGLKVGALSKISYLNIQISYLDSIDAISRAKQEISQLNLEQINLRDTWEERLRAMKTKQDEVIYEVNTLLGLQGITHKIIAQGNGIVTNLHVKEGDFVNQGQVLLNISSNIAGLEAITFVPAAKGKLIKVGMDAQVSPTTVKKLEYGDIKGKVLRVTNFPVSSEYLESILRNKELVNNFLKVGPVIEIRIELTKAPKNFSGYAWTSSYGPDQIITPGTLAEVKIAVRKQAPITLFIPRLEKLYGGAK